MKEPKRIINGNCRLFFTMRVMLYPSGDNRGCRSHVGPYFIAKWSTEGIWRFDHYLFGSFTEMLFVFEWCVHLDSECWIYYLWRLGKHTYSFSVVTISMIIFRFSDPLFSFSKMHSWILSTSKLILFVVHGSVTFKFLF